MFILQLACIQGTVSKRLDWELVLTRMSGLCRSSSRALEAGPVLVFVSDKNPGALAFFFLYSTGEDRQAYMFAQPFSSVKGVVFPTPLFPARPRHV